MVKRKIVNRANMSLAEAKSIATKAGYTIVKAKRFREDEGGDEVPEEPSEDFEQVEAEERVDREESDAEVSNVDSSNIVEVYKLAYNSMSDLVDACDASDKSDVGDKILELQSKLRDLIAPLR